ncbi:hypothetical protein IMAU60045_03149 [Lactiplantibacillus plantarum]|nr:hypothetical protein [Lactiplantibacillus plantarum]
MNELRTSVQIQNNKSTNAVIQDLVEPSKKATNENNVSDYTNLDTVNEENNFVLLSGAKNRQEIVNKTRELTQDSLAKHDKYERHRNRKYVSKEKQAALIMERFNSLKNKKQVKTFEEYEKLLATSSIEQEVINTKITDERLKVFEENSAKRRGSGATQELLLQIGTGGKYDPLTDEEKIKVAKATDKFLNNEFSDNLKPISSVMHTKESITHMQKLFTSVDDKGRLNGKQAVYDAMQKYNKRHGLQAFKDGDYGASFKAFVGVVDDFQRQKCIEYGYNKKYDFEFAKRGDVSKASKTKGKKSLRQIKVEQLNARDKEQDKRAEKLVEITEELAKRDKEVTQRENRVSDLEDENIVTKLELQGKKRKLDTREQEVQQRETKVEEIQKDSVQRLTHVNLKNQNNTERIVNFRDELLQAVYPKHDKYDLHVMAVKNEVSLKSGKKEQVVPHVFKRVYSLSVARIKAVMKVIKKAEQPDYFGDEINRMSKKPEQSSYSSKQKSKDDDLELQ